MAKSLMYAPHRKSMLTRFWPLISFAARSIISIIIIIIITIIFLKKILKWVNNFTQTQSNQNKNSVFPEHLLPFHQIRVTKALYDIMGVDVKHFIIEAYEQPVYLLVIVTFYNTHHDL